MPPRAALLPALFLLCAWAGPAGVTAGQVQAHRQRMLDAQDLKFGIIETLAAGSVEGVAADLDAIQPLLEEEIAYWEATGLADITSLARGNLAQVRAVRVPLAAGDAQAALDAWSRVEAGCSGCHDLHPEQRVRPGPASPGHGR
jgi:cytochrome c553